MPPGRRRLLVLAVVVAAAAVIALSGGHRLLSDPARVRATLRASGLLAPALYVLSMWVLQPLGPPGFFWMIPASYVWPWPEAFLLSWVGNLGASSVAFAGVRWLGRDWVAARIPTWLARVDHRLAASGIGGVLALRLITGQLPAADWLLGLSEVRWRDFLVGTALGIVPMTLLFVLVGRGLVAWLVEHGPVAWVVAGAVIALVLTARRLLSRPVPDTDPRSAP